PLLRLAYDAALRPARPRLAQSRGGVAGRARGAVVPPRRTLGAARGDEPVRGRGGPRTGEPAAARDLRRTGPPVPVPVIRRADRPHGDRHGRGHGAACGSASSTSRAAVSAEG